MSRFSGYIIVMGVIAVGVVAFIATSDLRGASELSKAKGPSDVVGIKSAYSLRTQPAVHPRAVRTKLTPEPKPTPQVTAEAGPDHSDPVSRAKHYTDLLTASGRREESWSDDIRTMLSSWNEGMPPELQHILNVDDLTCFRAGCSLPVRYQDRELVMAFDQFLLDNEKFTWRGEIHRTAPITDHDGVVAVTFFFLAPEAPATNMKGQIP